MIIDNKEILIHKYLTHQLNDVEKAEFEALCKDKEFIKVLNDYKEIWDLSKDLPKKKFNSKRAYESFLQASQADQIKKKSNVIRLLPALGSIAAIFLGVLFYRSNSVTTQSFQSLDNTTITLKDGSIVHLAAGSSFDYTEDNESRLVKLSGKAIFDVDKTTGKSFVVHAGDLHVTTLGTTFLVDVNNASAKVSVLEGKVEVKKKDNQLIVGAREAANVDVDNLVLVTDASFTDVSFYNPILAYNDEPIAKVLSDIERKFDIRISLTSRNDLSKCTFTSKDISDESLENILQIIQSTFSCIIKEKGPKQYQISRISCR